MSAAGAISTMVWVLIAIIIIIVVVAVLFKVINLLFIAPYQVSATPMVYTETIGRFFSTATLMPIPSNSLV